MAMQRLKDAAEKARCELSNVRETVIDLPFLHTTPSGKVFHMHEKLTVQQLEGLTEDLIEDTIKICARRTDREESWTPGRGTAAVEVVVRGW